MRPFIKRSYILGITLVLLLTSVTATASKKGRAGRKASQVSAKKSSRSSARNERRAKSARGSKQGRGERQISSRSRRGRDRIASRRGRGRHYARLRRSSRRAREVQAVSSNVAPRPTASGIPTERVTEIQTALIKFGYLEGPASGQYDDDTVEAMKQFQTDNSLPPTGLPSAHSLKRLGVSKRSNDDFAVPVKSVSETEKKHN